MIARYTYALDPRKTTSTAIRSTEGGPTLWYAYAQCSLRGKPVLSLQGQPVWRPVLWLDPFGKVLLRRLHAERQSEELKPGEEAYVERDDVVTLFVASRS